MKTLFNTLFFFLLAYHQVYGQTTNILGSANSKKAIAIRTHTLGGVTRIQVTYAKRNFWGSYVANERQSFLDIKTVHQGDTLIVYPTLNSVSEIDHSSCSDKRPLFILSDSLGSERKINWLVCELSLKAKLVQQRQVGANVFWDYELSSPLVASHIPFMRRLTLDKECNVLEVSIYSDEDNKDHDYHHNL
ncbi:hypothetical protein [Hymenobacter sp. IS2118]|uniref:hypothetical protein n=1 Tax=Hymenobacter sp. IS2118 TaxID=1505605 RepID=UPI00055031BD|nr:hypothetical protein [Hymenobacter sp. IS2118]